MQTTQLCTYRYDPLDRLTSHNTTTHAPVQRFYCKSRLATEIGGAISRSIVQHDDQLLAQIETQGDTSQATLLATNQQRSVLHAMVSNESRSFAYSPYGYRPAGNGLLSLLGFNGERPDPVTGYYLLGNGYRAFNPLLMRFNSPDKLSPFGEGGLNPYAYCSGDPINRSDPSGTTGIIQVLRQMFSHSGSRGQAISRLRTRNAYTKITAYTIKADEEASTIVLTQTKYTERDGITTRLGTTDTARYTKLTPKNPTLKELALSNVSNFTGLDELALDTAALERISLINFFNHAERSRAHLSLLPDITLKKYQTSDFYNKLLSTANSGKLQGVAPSAIKSLNPIKETAPSAYLSRYHEELQKIRQTLK